MGVFYDSFWAGSCIGRIEPDGRVYNASWAGQCIGRVEPDGKVYDSSLAGNCIGRIDSNGKIYNASWAGDCVGRVEPDGKVYDSSWAGNCIGRVDNMSSIREGAALRLLCISGSTTTSAASSTTSSTNDKDEAKTSSASSGDIPVWSAYIVFGLILLLCMKFKYKTFMILGIIALAISCIYAFIKRKNLDFSIIRIVFGIGYGVLTYIISKISAIILLLILNVFGGVSAWQKAQDDAGVFVTSMAVLFAISVAIVELIKSKDEIQQGKERINISQNETCVTPSSKGTNNEAIKRDTIISEPTHKWMCECGEMIGTTPCPYCSKGEKPQESIPENCWKCMGCGKYVSLEKDECDCGFKRKYL